MGFYYVFEKKRVIIAGAFLCCIIMVAFPEVTATASKEAIRVWLNAVVPALFPFLIMANFIKNTGIVGRIPAGIYPFVMALLSGYPMGARITADYYQERYIDAGQLHHILSYSMITGPAFIIGAVGVEFFDSRSIGYILACSHYLGAVLNGFLYGSKKTSKERIDSYMEESRENYYVYLTESILDSFRTIGIILAYIMMFMIGTDLLQFSGLLSLIPTEHWAAFAKGLLEMTVGCSSLGSCPCDVVTKMTLTSILISFGGLSVLGQSMSMLKRCPITLWQLLKMKISHGIFSGILTFTIYAFVV